MVALEAALADLAGVAPETAAPQAPATLAGRRLLYVGGRPKQIEQLRALAAKRGGTLLAHDGGIEDNVALLPGLLSQTDAALFPVDCVNHQATGLVKRLCRDMGKPFMPLRSGQRCKLSCRDRLGVRNALSKSKAHTKAALSARLYPRLFFGH